MKFVTGKGQIATFFHGSSSISPVRCLPGVRQVFPYAVLHILHFPKEPTSPKVSCMGEIKSKKKKKKKDKKLHKGIHDVVPNKNVLLWISKGSYEGERQGGKEKESAIVSVPPTLDSMKKFTSERGSLCDFDAILSER